VTRRQTQTARFFDDESERWSDLYAGDPQFRRRLRVLTSLIEQHAVAGSGGRALDAGCGSGVFTALLAREGYSVLAIDESEGMLEAARRHCARLLGEGQPGVEFRSASIADLALPARSFDVIVCLSVLEYIEDDVAVLRRLGNALVPGGAIVLSVPNRRAVVRTIERHLNRVRQFDRGRYLEFQRHQYRPDEFDAVLAEMGLQRCARRFFSVGFSSPHWVAARLERGFWAGMYAAVYRAHSDGADRPGHF